MTEGVEQELNYMTKHSQKNGEKNSFSDICGQVPGFIARPSTTLETPAPIVYWGTAAVMVP